MRKLVLLGLVATLGCGGGSSANKGQVDPGALDFCLAWGNGVCRLAFLCVDTASQDAAFRARYGTVENCSLALAQKCQTNQTGAQAFGPSCGPGKVVSQSAATTCQDNLDSMSCVDWMTTPAGDGCAAVCGGAPTGMDAGTGSDAGGDAGSSNGSVATTGQFCTVSGNLDCDRAFECDSAKASAAFGNLAGCKGFVSAVCVEDQCSGAYNPTLGASCVAATRAATCQELSGPPPTVCTSACP